MRYLAPPRRVPGIVALTVACLVASCSFTSLDDLQTGGGGASGTSGVSGSGEPSSSASSASSASSTSLSGGGEGGGNGGAPEQGGGGAGGDEVPPPDLVNTGLLARYFIDEAGSGDATGDLQDAATDPLALSIQDLSDVMTFVTDDGHGGLHWDTAGVNSIASLGVGTTKFSSLTNTVHGTIEVVARVDQASVYGSRLMHIGKSAESSFTLAISHPGPESTPIAPPTRLEMRTYAFGDPSAVYRFSYFDVDVAGRRVVIHAVYDSQQPDENDRIRMYVDGVRIARNADDTEERPLLGEQLFIDGGAVAIGNREIGERTIDGSIYYGAMYRAPLTDDEISQNAAELLRTDDR